MKVKVLYDFPAQAESSELDINKDDILTVVNKDIGEGWWEGINERGQRGLFPASYVEPLEEPKPSNIYENTSGLTGGPGLSPLSTNFTGPNSGQLGAVPAPIQQHTEEPDWPDEDWDDEDDSGDNATEYQGQRGYPTGTPYYPGQQQQQQQAATTAGSGGPMNQAYQADLNSATTRLSISEPSARSVTGSTSALAKPRKNFVKEFSNFAKTGLDSYLLDPKTMNVPLENILHIQSDPELGIVWKPNLNLYNCAVTKHGKETKMKGLKTYISYDITPSTNNIVVRRRYKHFDWLLQRMVEKFAMTPMPPLPEKQIAGRFQEDFVEHRRNLLQLWVNYITRHPVLSQCDVWWHFMTCSTDDAKGWKSGKRKFENDELVSGNLFHAVEVEPGTAPLEPVKTTKQLENFQRFIAKFDDAVRHMYTTAVDQSKKVSSIYAKDYKKLAESIRELSSAFQSGTAWRNSLGLNEAIRQTSSAYEEISRLHEEEPKYDFEPMADILHQYRGLLAGWPEILQLHKSSVARRSEHERLLEEGKISDSDLVRINQRTNVITYSTLAEINHFHNERLIDFKQMMQVFLTAQINFHTDILGKLQGALNKINDA